eukprot:TRINITY_DN32446_c0_g1_i1.p1 TRINITY_DN32446_c0_g1~~TRINITY_DN32446_c0_g1_i1.p1  ORF type:complete len:135 (-),score=17.27 TRINITY_DN32446_c0_g1_i1:349-753(-)
MMPPMPGLLFVNRSMPPTKFYAINSDREQVYDSFSLPSACLCHYKSPSSFRSNIQTRTRRNNLPFCKAGSKLSIQNNVNYFPTSSPQKQSNQQQVFRPVFEPQQSRPSILNGNLRKLIGKAMEPDQTQEDSLIE